MNSNLVVIPREVVEQNSDCFVEYAGIQFQVKDLPKKKEQKEDGSKDKL